MPTNASFTPGGSCGGGCDAGAWGVGGSTGEFALITHRTVMLVRSIRVRHLSYALGGEDPRGIGRAIRRSRPARRVWKDRHFRYAKYRSDESESEGANR